MSKIIVLRLGHRKTRDVRITTHVGLVARAFGADGVIISGERDEKLLSGLRDVCEKWGKKSFEISFVEDWLGFILEARNRGWVIIHLTMYGININYYIKELKKLLHKKKNFLVIVGAEKVPKKVYEIAQYNVAIGNQPHSEVSALAIFLDRLFEGRELIRSYKDAKIQIIPTTNSKKIIIRNNDQK